LAAATPGLVLDGALACQSATSWRYARSAVLGELALAAPDLLERVRGGLAFLAATGGHPGAQLERPELLVGQQWARERIVLAALERRPAQHRQLASGRDHSDLHPATRADPLIKRAQWPRCLDRYPSGLDEHPAGVRTALLGDPPVTGRLPAGLLDPRVQPEI